MKVKNGLRETGRLFVAHGALEISRVHQFLKFVNENIVCGFQALSQFRIIFFSDQQIIVTHVAKTRILINVSEERDTFRKNGLKTVCDGGVVFKEAFDPNKILS